MDTDEHGWGGRTEEPGPLGERDLAWGLGHRRLESVLGGAGEGEEEGGEAVEVAEGGGGDAVGMGIAGAEEVAFGAAADGAGEVGAGGGFGIAGQDELVEGGQGGRAPGGFGLEGSEGGGRELGLAGGEFGAEAEEVALDGFDEGGVGGAGELRAEEAEGGVEFVQGTDGVEERVGLAQARAAGEGGEGVVVHG